MYIAKRYSVGENVIVNNNEYVISHIHYYRSTGINGKLFLSAKFQNIEYFVKVYFAQFTSFYNNLDFYSQYYERNKHSSPRLIEHQDKKNEKILVFEYLKCSQIHRHMLSSEFDIRNPLMVDSLFRQVIDTLLVFEKDNISNGDVNYHNMLVCESKVHIVDFDLFDETAKSGVDGKAVQMIRKMIYDLQCMPEWVGTRHISTSIHECLEPYPRYKEIAEAIGNNTISSISEIYDNL